MSLAFSPDGQWLAGGGCYRALRIWEVETGRLVRTFREPYPRDGESEGVVSNVVFHPAGHLLAYVTPRDEARFRDTTNWEEVFTIEEPPEESLVREMVISPDGALLALSLYDESICFWDLWGQAPLDYVEFKSRSKALAMSPDGITLAVTLLLNGAIHLVDVPSRQIIGVLESEFDEALTVAFAADGRLLASGHKGGIIVLWCTETWEPVAVLRPDTTAAVSTMAFAPNSSILAVGETNNLLRLWDVRCFTQLASFPSAGGVVCYSPDGTRLALGAVGGIVRIWDALAYRSEKGSEKGTS